MHDLIALCILACAKIGRAKDSACCSGDSSAWFSWSCGHWSGLHRVGTLCCQRGAHGAVHAPRLSPASTATS